MPVGAGSSIIDPRRAARCRSAGRRSTRVGIRGRRSYRPSSVASSSVDRRRLGRHLASRLARSSTLSVVLVVGHASTVVASGVGRRTIAPAPCRRRRLVLVRTSPAPDSVDRAATAVRVLAAGRPVDRPPRRRRMHGGAASSTGLGVVRRRRTRARRRRLEPVVGRGHGAATRRPPARPAAAPERWRAATTSPLQTTCCRWYLTPLRAARRLGRLLPRHLRPDSCGRQIRRLGAEGVLGPVPGDRAAAEPLRDDVAVLGLIGHRCAERARRAAELVPGGVHRAAHDDRAVVGRPEDDRLVLGGEAAHPAAGARPPSTSLVVGNPRSPSGPPTLSYLASTWPVTTLRAGRGAVEDLAAGEVLAEAVGADRVRRRPPRRRAGPALRRRRAGRR